MNSSLYLFFAILIAAAVTIFTRAAPFLLFGNKKLPAIVQYLGKVLPPAIMIILVCYCLKSIDVIHFPHGLPELISCVVVAAVHVLRKNMYLSIIVGTICYMILIRVMGM